MFFLKSSCSWHCCLVHISRGHMIELHKNGRLGSFDCDSFETCESCLLGKDDIVSLYRKG